MTDVQAFTIVNIALPLIIVVGAFIILKLHERALRKDDEKNHPAE